MITFVKVVFFIFLAIFIVSCVFGVVGAVLGIVFGAVGAVFGVAGSAIGLFWKLITSPFILIVLGIFIAYKVGKASKA